MLGADELRAQRDELAARLQLLRAGGDVPPEPLKEAAPSAESNTRPGPLIRWRPSFTS